MKSLAKLGLVAFALTLVILLSFILVGQTTILIKSKAQVVTVDRRDSFVFLVPACGKAGNEELPIRVNVVALTGAGLGKGNIACKIVAPYTYKLAVRSIQAVTDTYGKAIFDVQAENPGIYEVKVICDDVVINDKQKLCFE